jgi:hypothetical protein
MLRRSKPRLMPVKPIDASMAIDLAAEAVLSGKKFGPGVMRSHLGPADAERVTRALGISIEKFNQMMSERLAILSDKIAGRIEEKIDADLFKTSELGFILSVTEDKRRALDSRAQLAGAQVNIQVNNYGEKSREEILRDLQMPTAGSAPEPDIDPRPLPTEDLSHIKEEDVI